MMNSAKRILQFPSNFLWGAATSSYQVEGANTNTDWWLWEQEEGRIQGGVHSGMASNHYHLYPNDFDIAKELNHNAHRFSFEWSRIEPREGEWNEEALWHYRNVIAALKERGIIPIVTIFHFTLPLWVSQRGGFENPEIVFYFRRYIAKLCKTFGRDISYWITLNEPMVYLYMGYLEKRWPPGKDIGKRVCDVVKNMISAHKEAYEIIHEKCRNRPVVGLSKNMRIFDPLRRNSPLDRMACKCKDYLFNQYFLKRIKNKLDFIGLNYYTRELVQCSLGALLKESKLTKGVISDLGWEIYPEGIYRALKMLNKYSLPIIITENGIADKADEKREQFIVDHLIQVKRALDEGMDIRGYLHWSLIDNFEWADGFGPRFGLVDVDYTSQRRTIRDSARTFAQICKTNQIIL